MRYIVNSPASSIIYSAVVKVLTPLHLDLDPSKGIHFAGDFIAVAAVDDPDYSGLLPRASFPEEPEPDSTWQLDLDVGTLIPWSPNPLIQLVRVREVPDGQD